MTRERWDAEDILRDAVLYRMLLLGEIASALPDELRDRYPDMAWRQVAKIHDAKVELPLFGTAPRLRGSQPVATRVCAVSGCRFRTQLFDPTKSASNREKHGVDFVQALELWQDPMRIEVPACTTGKPRWVVIGRMGDKHWSAVVTCREDRVRIISVRRARVEEVEIYEV